MLCVTATPIVRGPEYARFNELWRSAVHRARLIAPLPSVRQRYGVKRIEERTVISSDDRVVV